MDTKRILCECGGYYKDFPSFAKRHFTTIKHCNYLKTGSSKKMKIKGGWERHNKKIIEDEDETNEVKVDDAEHKLMWVNVLKQKNNEEKKQIETRQNMLKQRILIAERLGEETREYLSYQENLDPTANMNYYQKLMYHKKMCPEDYDIEGGYLMV